ncbi:MAG: DUF6273 domain-containing protein [Micrococcales bacterium]|nr:DUF6273 domain-containing protein [Micrococcales bacterium]
MDVSSRQDAAIARLEAKVVELEATVARLEGVVPPWGTPSRERPASGTEPFDDVVDGPQVPGAAASWGTPERRPGHLGDHDEGSDHVGSTAAEVDEVCRQIAGSWTAGSPAVWLSGYSWKVLDVVDGTRALLLADRVVARRPYHSTRVAITWQRCDLRRWLNDEFCTSLGDPLVSRVLTVKVRNEPNLTGGTNGGKDTKDRFFLLSMREAVVFFTGGEPDTWEGYRTEALTLDDRGRARDGQGKRAWWWLRSPGHQRVEAAYVAHDGKVDTIGYSVSVSFGGVRPAFWLSLQP